MRHFKGTHLARDLLKDKNKKQDHITTATGLLPTYTNFPETQNVSTFQQSRYI